jgi:hypothetical protein
MKHNKVNNFFSKLIIVLAFLLVTNAFSQKVIDTNYKYQYSVQSGKGKNDCGIRALASVTDLTYNNAYRVLKNKGRIDNQPTNITDILNHLNDSLGLFINMTPDISAKNISAETLISKGALNKEHNYMMYVKAHIYSMTYINNQWVLFGNADDMNKTIISLITLKRQIN